MDFYYIFNILFTICDINLTQTVKTSMQNKIDIFLKTALLYGLWIVR